MSFLSDVWDGIKSHFKNIGDGIKSAVEHTGKFMDDIGVAGQIAMGFILPGIGGALGNLIGKGVGALAGSSNAVASGVGKVLQTAGKFANTAGNAFKTVTDGVKGFVSKVGKGFVNSAGKALGAEDAILQGPDSLIDGFGKWKQGVADDVSNITSPFRDPANQVTAEIEKEYTNRNFPDVDSVLEDPTEIPKVAQPASLDESTFDGAFMNANKDFRFYEVPRNQVEQIAAEEKSGQKGFLQQTTEFAKDVVSTTVDSAKETAKNLPGQTIDRAAQTASEGVVSRAAQAVGLEQEPQYEVTNISNPVPQFNSTPITNQYEQSGLNYGGLPDNRMQFYAGESNPLGDFGLSGFQKFSQLRTV